MAFVVHINKPHSTMMPHHDPDPTSIATALELLTNQGFEGLPDAVSILLNQAMQIERSHYLGAGPYERADSRRGYANGFKPKTVKTRIGSLDLSIPQVRDQGEDGQRFYPSALEKGIRSERALNVALAEMYVQGVSTRRVTKVLEELCGTEITSMQVSRATMALDEELEQWRARPLEPCSYVTLDATYQKVRIGGSVVSAAVLVALGVRSDGKRVILGISVATSEAEVHWRKFIESLLARGLHGIKLITSDDHSGLRAALAATLPGVSWQRCQFHLQQNAQSYVSKLALRSEVADDIRSIFSATTEVDAKLIMKSVVSKYEKSEPKLAEWIDENIPEGLAILRFPPKHRKRLRTSNSIERLNKEIKRRTRVVGVFPNEASVLRLVTAMATEISEDWETGRVYLSMNEI